MNVTKIDLSSAHRLFSRGDLVFSYKTNFTDAELCKWFRNAEEQWPIGMVTAVRDGNELRVVDGEHFLHPMMLVLSGGIPLVRTFDGRYTTDDVPGMPLSVVPSSLDFLNWAEGIDQRKVDKVHAVVARIYSYEIPLVVVSKDRPDLREETR